MDQFALDEYSRFAVKGGARLTRLRATQFARLVMSHVDCDTIPFLWQYASRFVLFDNIFATENTPSTSNAIALIAGHAGETQWVKHGPNGRSFTRSATNPARPKPARSSMIRSLSTVRNSISR